MPTKNISRSNLIRLLPALALTVLIFSSCSTDSKLSKKVHTFFMSKRYRKALATIHEMDSINGVLKADTTAYGVKYRKLSLLKDKLFDDYTQLSGNYDNLKNKNNDLNSRYDQLMNSTLTASQKFDRALKNKEAELKEREEKLNALQALVHRQDSITNALESIVKNALLGFKSDELSVEVKDGKVYVSMRDKLLFKSGSAQVEDKGKDALKKLVNALNKNQDLDILIEGHTDNVPIKTELYKDNWDLSVARATSIVRYITGENKINPKRIEASGRGEYYPVASNDTPEGRAKNRRTEIILSPKLEELMKILESK